MSFIFLQKEPLFVKKGFITFQEVLLLATAEVLMYYKPCCNDVFASCKLLRIHYHTKTPRVIHVDATWKRPLPSRFNVAYTWCVCRVVCFLKHMIDSFALMNDLPLIIYFSMIFHVQNTSNMCSNCLHLFICVVDKTFCRSSLKDSELNFF